MPRTALALALAAMAAVASAHPIDSEVFAAVRAGDADMVEALLRAGADANAVERDGRTPLHVAAERDDAVLARLLLARGADIDAADEGGNTATALAAAGSNREVVETLLAAGAFVGNAGSGSPLAEAAWAGDVELVQRLAPLSDRVDQWLALDAAIEEGHLDVMRKLLATNDVRAGAKAERAVRTAVDSEQPAMLRLLLDHGFPASPAGGEGSFLPWGDEADAVAMAELLLDAGAPVDTPLRDGATPLHEALRDGVDALADLYLRRGASPHAETRSGETSLHAAAAGGNVAVMPRLLQAGLDVNATTDRDMTPLDEAAWAGCDAAAAWLRSHGGVHGMSPDRLPSPSYEPDPWSLRDGERCARPRLRGQAPPQDVGTDSYRREILRDAITSGRTDELESLLAATDYAATLHASPELVKAAALLRTDDVLGVLVARGARLEDAVRAGLLHDLASRRLSLDLESFLRQGISADVRDDWGRTPLHAAASVRDASAVSTLLAHGADPHARDRAGATPLHVAAGNNNLAALEALLAAGAHPAVEADGCTTPFHVAAVSGSATALEVLAREGVPPSTACEGGAGATAIVMGQLDLDVTRCTGTTLDDDCVTPLHLAARAGQVDVARRLIELGADVDAESPGGVTPLHVAARYARTGVARVLLAAGADPNVVAGAHEGVTPLDLARWVDARGVEHALLSRGGNAAFAGPWRPCHDVLSLACGVQRR